MDRGFEPLLHRFIFLLCVYRVLTGLRERDERPLDAKSGELPLAGFALRGFEPLLHRFIFLLCVYRVLTGLRERDERPLDAKSGELPLAGFALRGFEPLLHRFIFLLCVYRVLTGGERGIRTLGTSIRTYIRLAGERLRPTRPSLLSNIYDIILLNNITLSDKLFKQK